MMAPCDLAALTLHLAAESSGRMPITNGRLVHGAFLKWLSTHDSALSDRLHRGKDERRPFTLSALRGREQIAKNGSFRVGVGDRYWLRITSLEKDLSNVLLAIAEQNHPETLTLNGMPFRIFLVETEGKRGGCETFEELVQRSTAATRPPIPWFRFVFLSAATFHSGGQYRLFPHPTSVFKNLIEKWDAFSPTGLLAKANPGQFEKLCECGLSISRHHLKTCSLDFGTGIRIPGFAGRCEYRVIADDSEFIDWIYLLGNFCFYTGIGYRTTWGMGQTDFILP